MATFPLSVSGNGRYLVDAVGDPFLMVGDSPQGLIVAISYEKAQTYLADRAAKGINTIQVHLLANDDFGGQSNLATIAGLTPFTTAGDLSTPRAAYFDYVEDLIELAAINGMVVMLTAGHVYGTLLDLFKANGVTKCTNFGAYLGTRFGAHNNIIWDHGNDFQTWTTSGDNAVILAVSDGITSTAPTHLQTAWLDYDVSSSRDSSEWNSRVDVDFCYTYAATYHRCLTSYALTPAKPLFMGEANYEDEQLHGFLTTALHIRKQAYWAMTSGACGQFYSNAFTWNFFSGWESTLNSYPGLTQIGYLKSLFNSLSWWLLVPDTNSSHTVMTAGYGTYASTEDSALPNTNTYATCARASDGSCIVAYLPTSRQVTLDMTKIAGSSAVCRWFNPSTGSFAAIGTYDTTGTRNFTPASGDWVLLLESTGVPPTGTPVLSVR